MENPKREVDDLLDVLVALRWHRGAETVDRASGMSSEKVRSRLRGKTCLTVGDLSALLAAMRIDPVEFATWREAGFHPEVYLRQLERQGKSQVRHLRGLAAREPAEEYSAEEIRKRAEGLEVLRLNAVDAAREGALEILRTAEHRPQVVDRDSVCEAWGIVGAIQRGRGRCASAAHGLLRALVLGGAGQASPVRRASTLQRVAYLMAYRGDFEQGRQALEVGRLIAAAANDWQALGRVLVSLGGLLGRMGRLDESIEAYDSSLLLLPGDWHLLFSAYQGRGITRAYRGDLKTALEDLECSLAVLDTLPSPPLIMKGVAVWLKAEILLLRNDLPAARAGFEEAREIYVARQMRPVDIALILLRLAKVLVLQGNLMEFERLRYQMLALLGPIEHQNKLEAGAHAELMNLSLQGKLTAELLESLYRRMHGSAQAAPPLLPLSVR